MFYTIYKTTNLINGKFYIGKHKTKDLNDEYLGSGKLLRRAIKKYGIENFYKEILHICKNEEHMNILESILVVPDAEINYNLCNGGKGGFGFINKFILTENKRTQHNRNVSPYRIGHKHTKETIEKISLSKIGNKNWVGKRLSIEHKQKISSSKIGKKISGSEKRFGSDNGSFGTCWITNGVENKKINKKEFGYWADLGYNKGRIIKKEKI